MEALAEVRQLNDHEIELKSQSNEKLASLLREEELKWYQRSKAQFILEGDSNTRYFHGVANGRHRKKLIHSLIPELFTNKQNGSAICLYDLNKIEIQTQNRKKTHKDNYNKPKGHT